jgi:hypothetical protein
MLVSTFGVSTCCRKVERNYTVYVCIPAIVDRSKDSYEAQSIKLQLLTGTPFVHYYWSAVAVPTL